jgi:hypothetical protein
MNGYDLSRDRFFNLIGEELRLVYTQPTLSEPGRYSAVDARLQEDDAGVQLTFTLVSGQAALTIGGAGPLLYPQSLVTIQRADRLVYVRADGTLSLSQPGPDRGQFTTPLKYTVLVTQSQSARNVSLDFDQVDRRYVTGTATLPRDVPTSRTATYTSLFTSASQTATAVNGFNKNNAELTIDYSTNKVSGTVTATSTSSSEPTGTLAVTLNGQLNPATGRVSGTLTSPDGFTGPFSGRLYGPAGVEFGLAFTLSRAADRVIGTVVGVRTGRSPRHRSR